MKILILGNATWTNQNSVGNTLSNWFEGWGDAEFAFMYNRAAEPDNKCCKKYFCVPVLDVISNILTPWKIGRQFESIKQTQKSSANAETAAINNITGFKRRIASNVVEILYSSNIWLNGRAKKFIKDFNPDITFLFCIADGYRYNLVRYIKTHSKSKVVEFIADDVYGQSLSDNSMLNRIHRHRIPKLLKMADKVYGASEQMCVAYNQEFGIVSEPLYKGCTFDSVKENINKPLKFLYAGNLHFGRVDTLSRLVDVISKINENGNKIELSIYSNSYISEESKTILNRKGCHLYDARPYDEIRQLMKEADVVLHVESFEKEQIQSVRYSFSTKIIDCLQSGSVMLVIGPKGIASVEYPKRIPGAIVVDNLNNLEDALRKVIENPSELLNRAKASNEYAREHFEISAVRNKLKNDFVELLNK